MGSLTDRLAAIASAATLARSSNVDLKVVWPEGGDADFAAAWKDLYKGERTMKKWGETHPCAVI